MKKTTLLLAAAAFAFTGISYGQGIGNAPATNNTPDAPFGGPLSHRPTPAATPATDPANPGKKMVGGANLASDEKGKNATTSFPAGTTTVYLVTKNVSGAKGDKVRADWVADDAGKGLAKGKRFYNSAIDLPNTSSYNPAFHVTGPIKGVFPPGKYHVDLSVGTEKFKTLPFTVQ